MPMTWNQVNNMPDIASNNRYKVFFPALSGYNNKVLTDLVHTVSLPQHSIAMMQVRLFGTPLAFRGGREFDNTMEIRFLENVKGEGLKAVENWRKLVRNKDGRGSGKHKYAGNGLLEIYDTTGATIHAIPLKNMWPHLIQYPELDEGGSNPLEFGVTFGVDFAELEET